LRADSSRLRNDWCWLSDGEPVPRAVRELRWQRDPAGAEKEVEANDVRALMGSGGDWRSLVPSGVARVIDWIAAGEL